VSDHFDTDDSRTDLTDLYVFPSASDSDRMVLILDINPDASALEVCFDPSASYEIKIDTDGDLEADLAFHVLFAASADGDATANVYRATGTAARGTGPIGDRVVADARVSIDGSSGFADSNGYRPARRAIDPRPEHRRWRRPAHGSARRVSLSRCSASRRSAYRMNGLNP
jgi:hypothetical protein